MQVHQQDTNIVSFPFHNAVTFESQSTREIIQDSGNDSYQRVAAQLRAGLMLLALGGREFRILMAILELTYEQNKTAEWIVLEQLAEMTGLSKSHSSEMVNRLDKAKIITRNGSGHVKKIGINTKTDEWDLSANKTNRIKKSPNSGKKSPNTVKKNITEFGEIQPESSEKHPEYGENFTEFGDISSTTTSTTTKNPVNRSNFKQSNSPETEHPIFSKKPPMTKKNTGQPMTKNWQPDWTLLAPLIKQSGIPFEFANELVGEFKVFWMEDGGTRRWQSRFLNHIKFMWSQHQAEQKQVQITDNNAQQTRQNQGNQSPNQQTKQRKAYQADQQDQTTRPTNDDWYKTVFDEFGELGTEPH